MAIRTDFRQNTHNWYPLHCPYLVSCQVAILSLNISTYIAVGCIVHDGTLLWEDLTLLCIKRYIESILPKRPYLWVGPFWEDTLDMHTVHEIYLQSWHWDLFCNGLMQPNFPHIFQGLLYWFKQYMILNDCVFSGTVFLLIFAECLCLKTAHKLQYEYMWNFLVPTHWGFD